VPKSQWGEAERDWLPLRRAILSFYIDADGVCRRVDDKSRRELEATLKRLSRARSARIDPAASTFTFSYRDGETSGAPWEILTHLTPRNSLAWKATELVFRDQLLPAFDRAVSDGMVKLYARAPNISHPFTVLPADIWRLLRVRVIDWERGCAPYGPDQSYWSIHAGHPVVNDSPGSPLKQAPEALVDRAIDSVYQQAVAEGRKPPNIKELPNAVVPLLAEKGYHASKKLIMRVGSSARHKGKRRPIGKTLRSEQRARSK
jgi:hypothetical protein